MNDELIERLAAIEHERWADWQRSMHEQGTWLVGADGIRRLCFSEERIAHWERQIATPYADLSEREKQSDREQVERYRPLIEAHCF